MGQWDPVAYCLRVSDRIPKDVMALDVQARRTEGFRILRQGLEYALSVFVEHLPEAGFAFLRRWAAVDDRAVGRILKANLGKARLRRAFSDRVHEVLVLLGEAGPSKA